MIKNTLVPLLLLALTLSACKEASKKEGIETTKTETVASSTDDIKKTTSTNEDGESIDISYNNTKGTATLNFKGEIIELAQERAASGIWYKNDTYELRGKGEHLELKKEGKVVFKN